MRRASIALLIVACGEVHVAAPDASTCTWSPPPPTGLQCSVRQSDACIAWGAELAPTAIARCVLSGRGASQIGSCVSASACAGTDGCTCGAGAPCGEGSACMESGSSFVCVPCGR